MVFVEKRLTSGFEELSERLDAHVDRMDLIATRQSESEDRLAREVFALGDVIREVRDLLAGKLDDHAKVQDHEMRIRSLEDRIADR